MLINVNPSDPITAARIMELSTRKAPWHRAVWSVGVVFCIQELLEACIARQAGHLSDGSLKNLIALCNRTVGQDSVIPAQIKLQFQHFLKDLPKPGTTQFHALEQLTELVRKSYLHNWATHLAAGDPNSERIARCVVTHLLDTGVSDTYLHSWFGDRLNDHVAAGYTLAQVCEEAHNDIALKGTTAYEILVVFGSWSRDVIGTPAGWMGGKAVTAWLTANGSTSTNIRTQGGILLNVEARDVHSAVDQAAGLLDAYAARYSVGIGKRLNVLPNIWVKGSINPFEVPDKARGAHAKSLARSGDLFPATLDSGLDAAIELLAHLQSSSPSAAIAGGWAAIEALLADPHNRSAAADELAVLVACSIPRAELTLLSYEAPKFFPAHAAAFKACGSNRDRSELMARLIADKTAPIVFPQPGHQAAVLRVRRVIEAPSVELKAYQRVIASSFHRLYRQRNLILHGGITNSIALAPSLRTVARLVGAGIDRIAHAYYEHGKRPREIVAQAKIAIALAEPINHAACVDLLG